MILLSLAPCSDACPTAPHKHYRSVPIGGVGFYHLEPGGYCQWCNEPHPDLTHDHFVEHVPAVRWWRRALGKGRR